VITTLRRRGLPLIRYRTGDLASLTRAPCRCGSPLARLRKVEGRVGAGFALPGGQITMALLDEVLFSVEGVTDFSATVTSGPDNAPNLSIVLGAPPHWQRPALQVHCRGALREAAPIGAALATGALTLAMSEGGRPLLDHGGKRRLVIR
jgi:phenylacetate-coenzyme A ligase PaaK-like adenylate-forming protein